jgi:hypothetical protein
VSDEGIILSRLVNDPQPYNQLYWFGGEHSNQKMFVDVSVFFEMMNNKATTILKIGHGRSRKIHCMGLTSISGKEIVSVGIGKRCHTKK